MSSNGSNGHHGRDPHLSESKLSEIEQWLRPRLSPTDLDHAMRWLLRFKHLIVPDAGSQLIRMFERRRRSLR
jgi:hypothetical protein